MDQFVRGDNVSDAELRKVWRNTTQPGQGNDRAITEAFFRAVREVNASLRPERRLRVLLGDPPIDWDAVESRADHQEWLRLRDTPPAALIRREVLEPERRALVIYGGIHLQRRNLLSNYELVADPHLHTLVQQLEREGNTRVNSSMPCCISGPVRHHDVVAIRCTLSGTGLHGHAAGTPGAPGDAAGPRSVAAVLRSNEPRRTHAGIALPHSTGETSRPSP